MFFSFNSWILEFFHSADKNQSNTLTKEECRDLFENSLNWKLSDHVFERIFNVKFINFS